ncbi:MAG: hypothetical protein NT106_10900 [Candidatus Sumerlaeota bacterium]|nr:hypothetical protein [Candidatus Sumerlaeota bacterium]
MTFINQRKFKRVFPCTAIAASAFLLYSCVLRGDVILFGNDTLYHDYLMLRYGWGNLRGGTFVTWLPHLYCGIPFIGSFAFCPFYPPSWLFLVFSFPFAFNVQYVLHSILAGAFVYRLSRAIGLKRFPATVGGLGFQMCGHFATLCYPGHLQKVQAIVWIPLVISHLHRGFYSGKKRRFLYAGAALAMPLLSSHPQVYYYGIGAALIYTLWCVGGRRRAPLAIPPAKVLSLLATVILFSLAISAVQTMPAYETAGFSVRGSGMEFQDAARSSYPPEELWELLLPRFTGDSIRGGYGNYWGRWGERLVSDYLGMAIVILALVGSLLSARPVKFYFTLLFFLSMLIACGAYSPLYRILYGYVPGMRHFRSPATVMFLMGICAAVLAAFGFEALMERAREKTDKHAQKNFILIFVILGLLFFILTVMSHRYYLRVIQKSGQYAGLEGGAAFFYERLSRIVYSLRRSLFFAGVTLIALGLFFHTWFLVRSNTAPRQLLWLVKATILVLFFVDPAMNDRTFIQPEPAAPYHDYLYHSFPDAILKEEPPPVRVLDIGNELSNRPMMNGIGVPLGYHPVELRHYIDAWNAARPGSLGAARLTACPFVLSRGSLGKRDDLVNIASDVRSGKTLYRRADAVPYAYIPHRVISLPDEKTLLGRLSSEDFDPHQVSYVVMEGGKERMQNIPDEAQNIRVLLYNHQRVSLKCRLPMDALIVTGDVWMPGWRARLEDGSPLALGRANNAFRSIEVPKGNHVVIMEYRPVSLVYGTALSIFSLVLWVILVIRFRVSHGEGQKCASS